MPARLLSLLLPVLLLAGLAGEPALAQAGEPSAQDPLDTREIDSRRSPALDADIEARITGIFNEIDELSGIGVDVREGVVTLTGEVPSEAAIARAGRLASRLSGVVTVENRLERSLDVEANVSPVLEGLASSLHRANVYRGTEWVGETLRRAYDDAQAWMDADRDERTSDAESEPVEDSSVDEDRAGEA